MIHTKDIDIEVKEVNGLRELTRVYGEIASTRMKKIRGYVLRNREFLQAITNIFKDTLAAYKQKYSKAGKVTFLAHNGKTVDVFLSANTGFFGGVIKETFDAFITDVRKGYAEVTIAGRIGRGLFTDSMPGRLYNYFDLPDFGIDRAQLGELVKHLVQYEEIRVFYSKFDSLVTQKVEVEEISAGTPIKGETSGPAVYYIFEPSIEDILTFFETQMFASVFDQAIRESQLAKFASRILAMDRASQNIQERLKVLSQARLKTFHDKINIRQINSLIPIYNLIKHE